MPSSVRVGSRPPSRSLIFSNSSGVRPCSRIISGVTAIGMIAEVVIGKSSLSHLGELFACRFVQRFVEKKKREGWVERTLLSAAFDVDLENLENRNQLKNQDQPQDQRR